MLVDIMNIVQSVENLHQLGFLLETKILLKILKYDHISKFK